MPLEKDIIKLKCEQAKMKCDEATSIMYLESECRRMCQHKRPLWQKDYFKLIILRNSRNKISLEN